MDSDNVTVRKCHKSASLCNLSSMDISISDPNNTSSLYSTNDQTIMCLNETVQRLSSELQSAQLVIEKLNSENKSLKQDIENCNKSIDSLKTEITKIKSPRATPVGKRKRKKPITSLSLVPPSPKRKKSIILSRSPLIQRSPYSTDQESDSDSEFIHTSNAKTQDDNAKTTQVTESQHSTTVTEKSGTCNDTASESFSSKANVKSCNRMTNNENHAHIRRIVIIADQQGWNVCRLLQSLVGDRFKVSCFWKSNAKLCHLVNTYQSEINQLTKEDYVILLGGINDTNPYQFKSSICQWLCNVQNTNIIVSEIPYNNYLHEKRMNYELKFLCGLRKNAVFLDMNYARFIPNRNYFFINLCRSLLRDILRIDYKIKIDNYNLWLECNKQKILTDAYIQTDFISNDKNILIDACTQTEILNNDTIETDPERIPAVVNVPKTQESPNTSTFFRDQ